MASDLLNRLRYADPTLKKRIALGTLAGVIFVVAGVLIARVVMPEAPVQPDVPGLTRGTKAEEKAAKAEAEEAREQREREAAQLRAEMERAGVDPSSNPRGAVIKDGG